MLRASKISRGLERLLYPRLLGAVRRDQSLAYERKTPLEHILLRPGMYVGSVEWTSAEHWVYDIDNKRMIKRSVMVSPALLKIFDEIIVNAADNKSRDSPDRLSSIKVSVKEVDGDISVIVRNDGQAIPVIEHPKEKLFIPELIFGHLLTGSNFNDSDSRYTGGSHGYGAKLTNIFSKSFQVRIADAKNGLSYVQNWTDNMSFCNPPTISALPRNTASSVSIEFVPDLTKFGLSGLSQSEKQAHLRDIIALFHRRTYDIAGCLQGVKVHFNDELINLHSFDDYAKMFLANARAKSGDRNQLATTYRSVRLDNGWQIGLAISPTDEWEYLSFVNNVWTPRGGTHVNAIVSQVVKAVEKALKNEGFKNISNSIIRDKLMLFLNSSVVNPSFDGQTKDALITKAPKFAADVELSNRQLDELLVDSGILAEIIRRCRLLEDSKLHSVTKKTTKRTFLDIPKLEDAHFAGTHRALECTLILTEGDSAKALAVAGISATSAGREFFGVMPLRGKLLNVRIANKTQVSKNEELINLVKALGLDFKRGYVDDNLDGQNLRYGKVMLMCDQDHDGSHIKGLIINFFDHFWPNLLKHEGFLQEFITPIVKAKARKGSSGDASLLDESELTAERKNTKTKSLVQKNSQQEQHVFYSLQDYEMWRSSLSAGELARFKIKYYKGLGTSTAEEGRDYFERIDQHRKIFVLAEKSSFVDRHEKTANSKRSVTSASSSAASPMLLQTDQEAIDLVFNKHRIEDRKQWLLQNYSKDLALDLSQPHVSYKDFIAKELIHFSFSDNLRSIPSAIDGLKPSQRKVLYGSFRKNLVHDEIKVVQLAGYIAEKTAYHHGEAALHATIINMAQNFVGSNNIPLLEPIGQFGTRAKGGADFASPRYIFTKLSPLARLLCPAADDAILDYLEEDGLEVEPRFFLPIVPLLLINGSQGIGTGWSTSIPPFHPLQIIDRVLEKLDNHTLKSSTASLTPLQPWLAGFRGSIVRANGSASSSVGRRDVDDDVTSMVTADTDSNDDAGDEKEGDNSGSSVGDDTMSMSDDGDSASDVEPSIADFVSHGVVRRINATTLEISELPYQKWTEDYKRFLVQLVEKGRIKSFREMHTTERVRFEITAAVSTFDDMLRKETKRRAKSPSSSTTAESPFLVPFRLTSNILLGNMHAFTASGHIRRFATAEDILDEHFVERLAGYVRRKAHLVRAETVNEALASNKSRFIDDIIAGRLRLMDPSTQQSRSQQELVNDLIQLGYQSFDEIQSLGSSTGDRSNSISQRNNSGGDDKNSVRSDSKKDFAYLLGLPLQSLTLDQAQTLRRQAAEVRDSLHQLQARSEHDMWRDDLLRLRRGFMQYLKQMTEGDSKEGTEEHDVAVSSDSGRRTRSVKKTARPQTKKRGTHKK